MSLPAYEDELATVYLGECLKTLRGMPDASVDAVVTDPPGAIAFMGRSWDTFTRERFIEFMTDRMIECLRVLKPGGHALVWAIPRTSHWTATAVEDAGFEVRDVITHHFGSGFPKSLDVSKAIDKAAGAEREVLGVKASNRPNVVGSHADTLGGGAYTERLDTAPATDAARQWQGWGTSLKPASERWILASKPLGDSGKIEASIGALLCELTARTAARSSRPIPLGSPEERIGSAPEGAPTRRGVGPEGTTQTGTEAASPEATDTLPSESAMTTSLSIVSSWKRSWDALSDPGSTSTTGTSGKTTTALKTLSYLVSQITLDTIIRAVSSPSGERSLVQAADALFGGLPALYAATLTPSVVEPATATVDSKVALGGEPQEIATAPRTEPGSNDIILARKPLAEPNVASQVVATGTGAMNIDACRVAANGDKLDGGRVSSKTEGWDRPWKHDPQAIAEAHARGQEAVARAESLGRWPANLVLTCCGEEPHLDGCPVAEMDRQSGVLNSGANPTRRGSDKFQDTYGEFAGKRECEPARGADSGGASRFYPTFRYTAKASGAERNAGLFDTSKGRNLHPTVKPVELMRWLCRLITPPGGVVLDPFAGSGTTLLAAKLEGFRSIGIEKEPEHVEIIKRRLGWGKYQPELFPEAAS